MIADDQKFNIDALLIIFDYFFQINLKICDFALHGQIAVDLVKQNVEMNLYAKCDYELILMDCEMPFMDGYEASRQINSFLQSHNLRLPHIIAITGHTDQLHQDLCLKAGMEYVINKPVYPLELNSIIE